MHFTILSIGDLPGSLEKTFATKDPFKTFVSTRGFKILYSCLIGYWSFIGERVLLISGLYSLECFCFFFSVKSFLWQRLLMSSCSMVQCGGHDCS